MCVQITSVDDAPDELRQSVPAKVEILRRIPGPDRPDYWLGKLAVPLDWKRPEALSVVTHVILASKFKGMTFAPGIRTFPIGLAYVTDESVLQDDALAFSKCVYVATGIADDVDSSLGEIVIGQTREQAHGIGQALRWLGRKLGILPERS